MYDCIIIGAGPAGLTSAIYTKRAGLKTLVLEKETIGGQISSSPLVENYPGFTSITGAEFSNNLYEQIDALGVELELEEAIKIKKGKIIEVTTEYNTYQTKSLIIATGARYRLMGITNEKELLGKGIHFCVSCDGAFYKNKTVAVIGGGNSAAINAIYLSDICHKVYLIHRKDKLKCEKALIDTLKEKTNVEILYNTIVTTINGEKELTSIEINTKEEKQTINLDGMFISIGLDAQSNLAVDLLDLDEHKYIETDECKTKEENIFVAGDCRHKSLRQLTTAVNDGAIAATHAINYVKNGR